MPLHCDSYDFSSWSLFRSSNNYTWSRQYKVKWSDICQYKIVLEWFTVYLPIVTGLPHRPSSTRQNQEQPQSGQQSRHPWRHSAAHNGECASHRAVMIFWDVSFDFISLAKYISFFRTAISQHVDHPIHVPPTARTISASYWKPSPVQSEALMRFKAGFRQNTIFQALLFYHRAINTGYGIAKGTENVGSLSMGSTNFFHMVAPDYHETIWTLNTWGQQEHRTLSANVNVEIPIWLQEH